jgi:subtilisin family serine protease
MAVTYRGGAPSNPLTQAGFMQSPDGRNWYRQGRVLALRAEADKIEYVLKEDVLHGVAIQREPVGGGLVRFSWATDHDPGDIVDQVRIAARRQWGPRYAPKVGPDHLFGADLDPVSGQPFDAGGPAGFPRAPRDGEPDELEPRTAGETSGDGVVVGVVDTGVARGAATGPEAQDWLEGAFLARPDDIDELVYEGKLGNQAGHGTFITGIVLQHAPAATVRIARGLHANGIADGSEVAVAIDRLARSGIDILSLSLGCFTRNDASSMAIEDALRRLDRDIVVVAAAGNLHTGRPGEGDDDDGHGHSHPPVTTPREFWPAALPWVFSVGALETSGLSPRLADFSNIGGWVTAYTQGVDVLSTFLTLDDHRDPREPKQFNGFAYWSGTSFAAPAVAGAIAARMQQDHVTAHEAADRIRADGVDYPRLGLGAAGSTMGTVLRLEPKVRARRRFQALALERELASY